MEDNNTLAVPQINILKRSASALTQVTLLSVQHFNERNDITAPEDSDSRASTVESIREKRKVNPVFLLIIFCCSSFMQGALINGLYPSVVSTIERRFNYVSFQTAMIFSSYHIGSLLLMPFLTYFGGFGKKNLWVGYGMIIFGVSSCFFCLPHFLVPYPEDYDHGDESLHLCENNSTIFRGSEAESPSNQLYIYYFMTIHMVMGASTAPLYSIGVVYLVENVNKSKSAIYQGVFFAFAVFGVAGGYYAGGIAIRINIDDLPDSLYGADSWWLAYIVCGVTTIIFSVPMLALPESTRSRARRRSSLEDNKIGLRGALRDMADLFRNPIFILINLISALDYFTFLGLNAFLVKYVHVILRLPENRVAYFVGTILVLSGIGGQVTGGFIGSRVKTTKRVLQSILIFTLSAALISPMLLIRAEPPDIVGINVKYPSNDGKLCYSSCHCDSDVNHQPVCSDNKQTYLSPCLAGCVRHDPKKSLYMNCTCVWGADEKKTMNAHAEACERDEVPLYVKFFVYLFIFLFVFCVFMGKVLQIQITLSTVPREEVRSFALGIQWIFIRVFGAIPGPIVYGRIADNACRSFIMTSDGQKGACRFYDEDQLAISIFALCGIERTLNCILLFLSLCFTRKMGIGDVKV